MTQQRLRIITTLPRLDGIRTREYVVAASQISEDESFGGGLRLFFRAFGYDLVLLVSSGRLLLSLCAMMWLFPIHRWRLISLDIHLLEPVGWKQRVVARIKRFLLRKVDLHILYFQDLAGYERCYGISPAISHFVPFKVNSWESLPAREALTSDGEYVFCGGRSLRDLKTFKDAMAQVPYPGLLLYQQDASFMAMHGTTLDLSGLPSNVRVERHDGNNDTWIDFIRRAKLVVIPTLPSSIYAPGLSLYLLAMGLRRCVIISEGPQTHGLLKDEAIIVPPGDPGALAQAIRRCWEDDILRNSTADAGRRYAELCAGETRMLSDVVNVCGQLLLPKS
jgi:hypothetical protein